MESGGGAEGVDAGAESSEVGNPSSPYALTTTDDLREGIAQSWGLGPMGQYSPSLMSRAGAFYSSYQVAPPPKERGHRNPFVLSSFLRSSNGVNVYQPTGFSVERDLQAATALQEEQFSRPIPGEDPIDAAFGKGKPMLDKKIKDAPRPEEEGRLIKETDLRRRAIHVNKGRKDENDFGQ
jgi:hypothetical protein